MDIPHPYVVFLGDVHDALAAKTALGIVHWRREWCVGQIRLPGCAADAGLEDVDIAEAARRGAKTLVIGAVNPGGVLPAHWMASLREAVDHGLHIANGLHTRLGADQGLSQAAQDKGVELFDVRHPRETYPVGTGVKRPGKRLLTVGTDCSVGKKYTALALDRDMRARGFDTQFCATGQTGVLISGHGVSIDAVVADFISGAVEAITPAAADDHWDVIEGQGSLFHPSFAGVSLGLLHGAQPDAFVVCHEPTRRTMRNVANRLPSVEDVIILTEQLGRLTNPDIRCVGIAVNTEKLEEAEAHSLLHAIAEGNGLPATDPVRFGCDPIIDRLIETFGASA